MMKYMLAVGLSLTIGIVHAVTFREFSGVCQGGDLSSPCWDTFAGWNRFDISWSSAEPEEGKFNEAYLEKIYARIKQNLDRGVQVLPMIGYAPGWASHRGKYEFISGNIRRIYLPLDGNRYLLKEYRKQKNGNWELQKQKDGGTERIILNPRIPLAPENISKWRKFIRRIVSDLRAKPYCLEYFQIWNEAHPKSGFYDGSMTDYLKKIHQPAAEEIHSLGGKVVYGGYPCCGSVDALANALSETNAWNSIDVIDIHYFPEWCMEYLRRKAEENGRPDLGVWQTEILFHRKYYAVAQIYPTVLYWGLTHNWSYPERYKLMAFAFGSPDDPKAYGYGKCLLAGKKLTPHGKALETLAEIFGGENIYPYNRVWSEPRLEFANRGDRMSAFRFGNKILVAAVFENATLERQEKEQCSTLRLTFPDIAADSIAAVTRIGIFGETTDLSGDWERSENGILVRVPLLENAATRYSDQFLKENSLRRPALYVLVELRK